MPRPARESTTPWRSSSWYAFATVLKLMTFGSATSRTPGSISPGRNRPDATPKMTCATICSYFGTNES